MVAYSSAIADRVCDGLAAGRSLREVCRADGMPSHVAVLQWARDDVEGFAARYRAAREIGWLALADEMMDIADDGTNDFVERRARDGSAVTVPDLEHINRSRLRVDTRKWVLAKMLPKVFGDRLALAGDAENPIQVNHTANPDERIRELLARARGGATVTAECEGR